MRADFIRMTSTTGGTSTLTCTAQTGYPLVSNAFTGTRLVDYSISEYTDSTKVTLSKAETGIGSYNTSTEVLTRTKVLSTWSGSAYLPKFGTATAPSAISFGSTSANIDIMISPMSGGILPPIPFVYGTVASVSDGLGALPLNSAVGGTMSYGIAVGTGVTAYFPVLIGSQGPFSQATVRCTTAMTAGGGAASTFSCAIYEIDSTGVPGKRLIDFGSFGRLTATGTFTTAAIATPVYLVPGWYYMATLLVVGSDTGNIVLRGCTEFSASPAGTLFSSSNWSGPVSVGSQTTLNDPATTPTGRPGITNIPAVAFK